jgi:hypothetical protein
VAQVVRTGDVHGLYYLLPIGIIYDPPVARVVRTGGAFAWARGALCIPKRRFPARAVVGYVGNYVVSPPRALWQPPARSSVLYVRFPAPRAAACLAHYLLVQKVSCPRFTTLNSGGAQRRVIILASCAWRIRLVCARNN